MADGYLLSESDLALLRDMIARERGRQPGFRSHWPWAENGPAPEVYLAQTLGELAARVGTVPGYADCDVLRIVHDDPDAPYIETIDNMTVRVYNVWEEPVPAGNIVPIIRDKFGRWMTFFQFILDVECGAGVLIVTKPA